MDIGHALTKWISHNRYIATAGIILAISLVWIHGCKAKTGSILTPDHNVTRAQFSREASAREIELKAEIDQFYAALDIGLADLDAQDEMKRQIVERVAGVATGIATGAINPAQAIVSGISLFGLIGGGGLLLDNRRKDKIIKKKGGGDDE